VKPLIAISMGDSLGIGAEVLVKSLADQSLRSRARWVIFGEHATMQAAADASSLAPCWTTHQDTILATTNFVPQRDGDVMLIETEIASQLPPQLLPALMPRARAGAASYQFVLAAIELAKLPPDHPWRAHAVVTAPINKHHWSLAGHTRFPGHTELFAHETGTDRYAMMFHASAVGSEATNSAPAPGLNVILVTVHQPLRTVPNTLTTERILEVIDLGASQMQRLGVPHPRIGVCGLNPHAGEHGLLGEEDEYIIAPAVQQAQAMGHHATGPHPADTIFQSALSYTDKPPTRFDLVVAMYHDQGLAPLKTLAWDRAVNLTVGLPFPRTSPDHGTAQDIAGKAIANPASMHAAMMLASSP